MSSGYEYEDVAPFQMTEATEPAPDPEGEEDRATESYQYDQGLGGLWAEIYGNPDLSGMTATEGIWTDFDNDWGTGGPPGVSQGDGWSIRWTGLLRSDGPLLHIPEFRAETAEEDLYTVTVDQTTVAWCEYELNYTCGGEGIYLTEGLHPITVEYHHLEGDAAFALEWHPGDFDWQVLDPQETSPQLGLVTTTVTDQLLLTPEYPDDEALAQGLPGSEEETDPVAEETRRTETTYDPYGRVLTVTTAAGTALAATSTNTYTDDAQAGNSCLTETEDPTGAVTEYQCNGAGDVITTTQYVRAVASQPAQERVTVTAYDDMGRVIGEEGPEGSWTETTYDLAGRPIRIETLVDDGGTPEDPQDDAVAITEYEYDPAGRLLTETQPDPDGEGPLSSPVIGHQYDSVGNEIAMTDARGKLWETAFDASDRVIAETTPTGLVTATDHELSVSGTYANRVTVTDPFGVDTVTTKNVLGRPVSEKVGTLNATTFEYDVVGNVMRTVDPAGVWTEQDYDGFGQVIDERTPYGDPPPDPYTESWLGSDLVSPPYQLTADPIWVAGTNEGTSKRLDAVNEACGTPPNTGLAWPPGRQRVKIKFSIEGVDDSSGLTLKWRVVSVGGGGAGSEEAGGTQGFAEPGLYTKTLEFDSVASTSYQVQVNVTSYNKGRAFVQEITHEFLRGPQAVTTYRYDAAGNLTETDGPRTDANDSLAYEYDLARRLTRATQSGISTPNATQYLYDDVGELVKVTDPEARVRLWTLDKAGRESEYIDPLGTNTSHYNAAGWLTSQDDPRGLTLRFAYDLLGRQTRRWAEDGAQEEDAEAFTFDPTGNTLTATVEDSGLETSLTYDDDGRLVDVVQGTDQTTYQYESSTPGLLTSVTDPTGGTTSYAYDQNGLLETLTDPLTEQETTYGLDQGGRLVSRADPAGLLWSLGYSASGGVASQVVEGPGSELASFALRYDPAGNVIEKDQTVDGAPSGENGTWAYEYDGANRLVSATDPADVTTTYGYDGAGNRTSVKAGSDPAVTTSYDSAGLPTSSSDGSTFDHDEVGSLLEVQGPGPDWTYSYDAWRRMTVAAGSAPITYEFDALNRMTERVQGTQSESYRYVGPSDDLASISDGSSETKFAHSPWGPIAQEANQQTRFLVEDLHGDALAVVSLSGSSVGSQMFTPWGERRESIGEGTIFGFQGDPTDPETGLVDMGIRLYDPSQGRFTSRDSLLGEMVKPLSLNQFVYGVNNPVTFVDPDGMKPKKKKAASKPKPPSKPSPSSGVTKSPTISWIQVGRWLINGSAHFILNWHGDFRVLTKPTCAACYVTFYVKARPHWSGVRTQGGYTGHTNTFTFLWPQGAHDHPRVSVSLRCAPYIPCLRYFIMRVQLGVRS